MLAHAAVVKRNEAVAPRLVGHDVLRLLVLARDAEVFADAGFDMDTDGIIVEMHVGFAE